MDHRTCIRCTIEKPTSDFYYLRDGRAQGPYCKACLLGMKRASWAKRPPPTKPRGPTFAERFWSKVDRSGGSDSCWPWLGHVLRNGYGRSRIGLRDGVGQARETTAHRFAYELAVGLIPAGFHVDHLCHTTVCTSGDACHHRRCCNPAHLKPVPPPENARRINWRHPGARQRNTRKTHCAQGHPYDQENTHYTPKGWRVCRECSRLRQGGTPTRERSYVPKPRRKAQGNVLP